MENETVVAEENFENADVFCGDCNGQMQSFEIPKQTPKLFSPKYYQKLILQCTLCKKTSKIFTQKIKR